MTPTELRSILMRRCAKAEMGGRVVDRPLPSFTFDAFIP